MKTHKDGFFNFKIYLYYKRITEKIKKSLVLIKFTKVFMGNQQSTVKEDDESEQPEPVHSQTKDYLRDQTTTTITSRLKSGMVP